MQENNSGEEAKKRTKGISPDGGRAGYTGPAINRNPVTVFHPDLIGGVGHGCVGCRLVNFSHFICHQLNGGNDNLTNG